MLIRRDALRCLTIALFVLTAWPSLLPAAEPARLEPESAAHFEQRVRPVLVKLCGECHDPEEKGTKIDFLRSLTADDVAGARGIWKNVAEQLSNRTMPPSDAAQPTEEDRLEIAAWIERTLRATACSRGEYAGVVTPRRLNRFEYDATIRDLLGVESHGVESFPVDGSGGEGFTNNGETLYLPPVLMERYLESASELLNAAIIPAPLRVRWTAAELSLLPHDSGATAKSLAPRAEAAAEVTIYVAGQYTVRLAAATAGAVEQPVVLKLDGIAAERWSLPPAAQGDAQPRETSILLTRGVHLLSVQNVGEHSVEIDWLEARDQFPRPNAEQTARHQRLLGLPPGTTPQDGAASAREILYRFARQAFRRPATEQEVGRLLALYHRAAERGDPFEESIKLALKGVLVSPAFLFRIEADPVGTERQPATDHELAVRLSYFLWSTQPDEELARLADAGTLSDPQVLAAQVDRMLDDPRSGAFADQFIGQWLGTHEVGGRVAPDTSTFEKQFTTELLLDFREEPVRYFQHLLATNDSVLKLLDSRQTVVNDRVAEFYGWQPVAGDANEPYADRWRRREPGAWKLVDVPDDRRGGVLGMGAVHLLTSYPDRTSPVLRGGWILETLLGVHVPSPPPDVPQLKRDKKAKQTLREQLAAHRDHAACAACHNLMDPLGFALENFDVLGRWREEDRDQPIDNSASLPSGEMFNGPHGLRAVLWARRDDFTRQMTAKLLGYALGRSLEDGDDCTIQQIADKTAANGYAVRTLIRETALSTPFRYKQAAATAAPHPQRAPKPNRREKRE